MQPVRVTAYKVILKWQDQKLDIWKMLYVESGKGTEIIWVVKSGLKLINKVITCPTSQQKMLRWPQEVTTLPWLVGQSRRKASLELEAEPCPGLYNGSCDLREDGATPRRATWGQEVGKR